VGSGVSGALPRGPGLQHPHILSLHQLLTGVAFHQHHRVKFVSHALILELAGSATLQEIVQHTGAFSEPHARAWFADLVGAVAHCHARGVAHRDLKPAQVLFAPDTVGGCMPRVVCERLSTLTRPRPLQARLLLSDFDCSSARPPLPAGVYAHGSLASAEWRVSDWAGSPAFMAPEVCARTQMFFRLASPRALRGCVPMCDMRVGGALRSQVHALWSRDQLRAAASTIARAEADEPADGRDAASPASAERQPSGSPSGGGPRRDSARRARGTPGETTHSGLHLADPGNRSVSLDPWAADAWGLGVILFVMLTGEPPVASPTESCPRFHALR
jgi:serine/threonine protein kinase